MRGQPRCSLNVSSVTLRNVTATPRPLADDLQRRPTWGGLQRPPCAGRRAPGTANEDLSSSPAAVTSRDAPDRRRGRRWGRRVDGLGLKPDVIGDFGSVSQRTIAVAQPLVVHVPRRSRPRPPEQLSELGLDTPPFAASGTNGGHRHAAGLRARRVADRRGGHPPVDGRLLGGTGAARVWPRRWSPG